MCKICFEKMAHPSAINAKKNFLGLKSQKSSVGDIYEEKNKFDLRKVKKIEGK